MLFNFVKRISEGIHLKAITEKEREGERETRKKRKREKKRKFPICDITVSIFS